MIGVNPSHFGDLLYAYMPVWLYICKSTFLKFNGIINQFCSSYFPMIFIVRDGCYVMFRIKEWRLVG